MTSLEPDRNVSDAVKPGALRRVRRRLHSARAERREADSIQQFIASVHVNHCKEIRAVAGAPRGTRTTSSIQEDFA